MTLGARRGLIPAHLPYLTPRMPSQYQILPDRNLVYIRHYGRVTSTSAEESFAAFLADPRMRPGQNHLADFSEVTSFDMDHLRFMQFMARIASDLTGKVADQFLVLYGLEGPGHELVMANLRTWDGQPGMTLRIAASEAEALDMLGLPERRFSALFDPRELALSERPQRTDS